MTLPTVLIGAAAGLVAGVVTWRWLRTTSYRRDGDLPRLPARLAWLAVPAAASAGALSGVAAEGWLAASAWVYLVGAVPLVWIDLDVHRVPDRVLRWWSPALLLALVVATSVGDSGWGRLGTAAAGAAAMGLLFLILALVGSMGLGDVKLACVTGLMLGALGWGAVMTGVVVAFLAGAVGAVWLLARGATRDSHLAFGPAIIAGAAVAIVRAGLGG